MQPVALSVQAVWTTTTRTPEPDDDENSQNNNNITLSSVAEMGSTFDRGRDVAEGNGVRAKKATASG